MHSFRSGFIVPLPEERSERRTPRQYEVRTLIICCVNDNATSSQALLPSPQLGKLHSRTALLAVFRRPSPCKHLPLAKSWIDFSSSSRLRPQVHADVTRQGMRVPLWFLQRLKDTSSSCWCFLPPRFHKRSPQRSPRGSPFWGVTVRQGSDAVLPVRVTVQRSMPSCVKIGTRSDLRLAGPFSRQDVDQVTRDPLRDGLPTQSTGARATVLTPFLASVEC